MGKIKTETIRKRIEKDLVDQLHVNGTTGTHFTNLVGDYLALFDLKTKLIKDIDDNGTRILTNYGAKSNPAINDLHKTNAQMLKILSVIGVKPSKSEGPSTEGDDV